MIKALSVVAIMMTAPVASAGVSIREQTNSIVGGNFSAATLGGTPPKPWQCSKNAEGVRVAVETPVGHSESERWVRLVDDTDKGNANIRQVFSPVKNGSLQVRLISNKDGGRLFLNLGSGSASKTEERALQLGVESDGSLVVRGEKKAKTASQIKTGEVYLVRCDIETIKEGKALKIQAELVNEKTQQPSRVEMEIETQVAIAALRITSTGPDTGVDYYITDVSLTGR